MFFSTGTSVKHLAVLRLHRFSNTQPAREIIGDGTSPSNLILSELLSISGFGLGTAEIKASVYG